MRGVALIGVILTLARAGVVVAGPSAADATFERGRALLKAGKYADAYDAFQQSQRLDPQGGTLYNIAVCEEHLGRLATARAHYLDLARADTNAQRRDAAAKAASALAPRVPKLVIAIDPRPPPQLRVAIDGNDSTALVGVEVPVDLGEHAIEASAPGYRDVKQEVTATEEGKVVRLELPMVSDAPAVAASVAPPADSERRAQLRLGGEIAMLAGGAAILVSLGFGWEAHTTYDFARTCTSCDGKAESARAVSWGNRATATFAVGASVAALGAAAYLVQRYALRGAAVAPDVGADHAGVAWVGAF